MLHNPVVVILAAALAAWIFGAVWYGALGKVWQRAQGLDPEACKGQKMPLAPMAVSFVSEVVMAFVLSGVLPLGEMGWMAGAGGGLLIGAGNAGLIRLLKVPPIIATLAMSFIVQSVAIAHRNDLLIQPPTAFAWVTTAHTLGVPLLAVLGIVLTAALGVVLHRTVYGQSVLAIGQNARAAWLAGFRISRTRVVTYALSGMLAALCGALLAAFSGGASLDMGNEYLMASIAIVVIGGTSASGGRANLLGIWGAALFLYLLQSMLNSLGVGMGWRLVLNGFIVVAVIVAAGGEKWER